MRAISGFACLIVGIGLIAAAILWHYAMAAMIFSGAMLVLCGGFQIFESRKGWCVLRAMGIKTRL